MSEGQWDTRGVIPGGVMTVGVMTGRVMNRGVGPRGLSPRIEVSRPACRGETLGQGKEQG